MDRCTRWRGRSSHGIAVAGSHPRSTARSLAHSVVARGLLDVGHRPWRTVANRQVRMDSSSGFRGLARNRNQLALLAIYRSIRASLQVNANRRQSTNSRLSSSRFLPPTRLLDTSLRTRRREGTRHPFLGSSGESDVHRRTSRVCERRGFLWAAATTDSPSSLRSQRLCG